MNLYDNINLLSSTISEKIAEIDQLPSIQELNDEQINFFFKALNNKDIVATDSLMFARNFDDEFERQMKFLPNVKSLCDAQKWLIPNHRYGNHWILMVVHLIDHIITIYDSMVSNINTDEKEWAFFNIDDDKLSALDKVRQFLHRYGTKMRRVHFKSIPWKMSAVPLRRPHPDGVSCGIYVTRIAELCAQIPDQIINNIGLCDDRNRKVLLKKLSREHVLLVNQIEGLQKNQRVTFNVLDRALFEFDFMFIDYYPDTSESYGYNIIYSYQHIKLLESMPLNQIGNFGVFLHYLPDPRLSYNRSIPKTLIGKEQSTYMVRLMKKKLDRKQYGGMNWSEFAFDFMMDFDDRSFAEQVALIIMQCKVINKQSNNNAYTIVSVDVNIDEQVDGGCSNDFLTFERILCLLYYKLVKGCQHVRLILVSEQIKNLYVYARAWRFICWCINYSINIGETIYDHWKKADYLMNDQIYSLLTSFPLGFLHVILYKDLD
jgi:hypothetical protein